jgi:hypothetical protein
MKHFFAVKKLTVKMQMKISMKEWKEELENFKKAVIEIVNPPIRTTKALERDHKIRNITEKALREVEMKKLEELNEKCYKNWDSNDEKIEEKNQMSPIMNMNG